MKKRTRFAAATVAGLLALMPGAHAAAQSDELTSGGERREPMVFDQGLGDYKTVMPAIDSLWLADAVNDTLIEEISPGEVFDRADLPAEVTVVAVANADTESVQFGFGGVMSYHVENNEPYALEGDSNGDLYAAPLVDGWHVVRATPFAANGAVGSVGDEVLLSFAIFEETIVVDSTVDGHDAVPGDGECRAPLTGGIGDKVVRSADAARPFGRVINNTLISGGETFDGIGELTGETVDVEFALAGPCTLRAAIEEANARGGRQLIEVPNLGTYELTLGELQVTDTVTIEGTGGRPLVDANGASRVMSIESAGDVEILSLAMRHGVGQHSTTRGGVVNVDESTVLIEDSRITDGQANFGGGIYAQHSELTVRRSVVQDNTAGHPDGFGNSGSTQRGGGISVLGSTMHLESSSVIGNYAVRGGGVSIAGGQAFIHNTSILENEAVQQGGGFELLSSDGTGADVHMAWSTVALNHAGTAWGDGAEYRTGGGFYIGTGSLISANSIIAENTTALGELDDYYGPDCYNDSPGAFISYRGNLVGVVNDACVMHDSHLDEQLMWDTVGSNAAPADPGFTSISYTVRPTMQLAAGSQAVDHGTGAPGVEFYGYCPDTDGRDQPRPADDAVCDIGAYERQ